MMLKTLQQSYIKSIWGWTSPRFLSILRPADVEDRPSKTSAQVVKRLTDCIIGGPNNYDMNSFMQQRKELMEYLPKSQEELPPRRMLDSFDQALIPIGSDIQLQNRYITHLGNVRVGRLLEDMDVFAVHLVFKHMLNPLQVGNQSPFSIVTALVDRIDVHDQINANEDIKMMGHVTWVGKSSAESTLVLEQYRNGKWVHVTEATFVLVARDPINKGSSFVNKLTLETDEEKKLFERGERNRVHRLASASDSLFRNSPSESEKNLIHDFFIQTVDHKAMSFKARILPENSVWMENTKLKNLIICQPEDRNRFNKIFGGYIMRQAFELAWANAFVFTKQRPFIQYMDDISFKLPVDIGSLLYFNSQVCYTEGSQVQIRVSAEVLDPESGKLTLTNVFQYTFKFDTDKVPNIVPKTYHEAMMYLEGRRHFLASTKLY